MTFCGRVVRLRPVRTGHRPRAGGGRATVYADLELEQLASCHARQLFYRDRRAEIVPALLRCDERGGAAGR